MSSNKKKMEGPADELENVQAGTEQSGGAPTVSQATDAAEQEAFKDKSVQQAGNGKASDAEQSTEVAGNSEAGAAAEKGDKGNDKIGKIAKEVFKNNTNLQVIYFTSDFLPFGAKQHAEAHAASLKDTSIVEVEKD
jgi:hypothetical protein